ncbi:uncharacterized protein LOC110451178 [Mizuhopecten yessoensis]|uniref:GRB2-associated and regulator of MAPK protein n=1 Tax=Mizuhopecten yessoensis TaxID=6573 RepID=A0A210QM75_MIZYE|nr:uncharacterized protein LOC110451178 [Mizuhopecten yessoensis]OWF49836.1 GRB2-associated and regulator of MAPK protein [Mizuhopecten yessoensis]
MAADPVQLSRPPPGPRLLNPEDIGAPRPVKHFLWEDSPRLLKDMMSTSRLPFTAKVHTGDIGSYVPAWTSPEGAGEDEEEVLHVIETRRKKAVVARKMQWDRQTGDYAACGNGVEIPATYKGWFEVLPEDGRPVEYFDSIQAITNVKPRRFLVRTATVGYQLSAESGVNSWVPYEIRPGAVLTTGIIFMDQKKSRANVKSFFKKLLRTHRSGKKEQDLKYLQCFDTNGTEVMIPIIMSGVFSPIGETAEENFDSVYELQDLILAFHLPVKAQLIHEEDQECPNIVPHGIVRVEEVRDTEWVVFGRYPISNADEDVFELPMDADIQLQKDISRKRKSKKQSPPKLDPHVNKEEHVYANAEKKEIELPVRVKEQKKNKVGLFDKLSVRSKTRKERASLKALQVAGVFTSRLSKSEVNFQDMGSPEMAADTEDAEEGRTSDPDDGERDKGDIPPSLSDDSEDKVTYTTVAFNGPPYGTFTGSTLGPQNRDLPPIPKSPGSEKEALYEELPVAPKPPPIDPGDFGCGLSPSEADLPDTVHSVHGALGDKDDDEDGYMSPAQLRLRAEQTYAVVRNKPPTAPPREAKLMRARKARSEIPSNYSYDVSDVKENNEKEIDDLFRFTLENDRKFAKDGPYASSEYKTTVNAQTVHEPNTFSYENAMKFVDDQCLETRSNSGMPKFKSRSHRSLNFDANATVRSHNIRKMKNAMDVFNFSDSFQDLHRNNRTFHDNDISSGMPSGATANSMYSSAIDRNPYSSQYARSNVYPESEPGFKRYARSASVSGLSEHLTRQADDSAISGDYGYHGDSEYSYQEYSEYHDDHWVPPDDLSSLTVLEVSKSLHYIGMKDRVVIRLANEQIDGSLLCSLDKQLLREGFPELNALDVKKILDFINGWRPKKK